MSFVRATTDRSSPQYTAPDDRIATFDNDGTLWVEHPFYTEGVFSFDRIAALAAHSIPSGRPPSPSSR